MRYFLARKVVAVFAASFTLFYCSNDIPVDMDKVNINESSSTEQIGGSSVDETVSSQSSAPENTDGDTTDTFFDSSEQRSLSSKTGDMSSSMIESSNEAFNSSSLMDDRSSDALTSSSSSSSSSSWIIESSSDEPVVISMIPPRSFVALQPGNVKTKVAAQHRAFDQTPLQSTGYYVLAGDVITASYSYTGSAPNETPQVLIHDITNEEGTYNSEQFVTLAPGENIITAQYDGIIYFAIYNEPTDGEITLNLDSGGRIMPRFVHNYHTNAHLDSMITEFSSAPWVELVGASAMVTATRESAVTHIDDAEHLMALYDTIIAAGQEQYALKEGNDYPHDPIVHKFHFVEIAPSSGYYMFSWFYRMTAKNTAINSYLNAEFMRTDAWGMWHEYGHQLQMRSWTWEDQVEVTVNITSAHIEKLLGNDSRFERDNHYDTVFEHFNKSTRNYHDLKLFPRAIMFWQLQLTFGDDYYKTVGTNYRNMGLEPRDYSSDKKKQTFIIESSRVAGYDLTPFFEKWGIPVDWETKTTLGGMSLKVLTDPIWENRDSNLMYTL
ncbi:MAG: M60 family metallopeptidase [Fibrobacterales bacterium]